MVANVGLIFSWNEDCVCLAIVQTATSIFYVSISFTITITIAITITITTTIAITITKEVAIAQLLEANKLRLPPQLSRSSWVTIPIDETTYSYGTITFSPMIPSCDATVTKMKQNI